MLKIVGLGEVQISSNYEDIIKTFGLGSCVAITMYSKKNKVLCMDHVVLPDSGIEKGYNRNPSYFGDTVVALLLNNMIFQFGCEKREIEIHLFGGAASRMENDVFCIGKRNLHAITKSLANENLYYDMFHTGEYVSRTVEMYVETGKFKVTTQPLNF